MTDVEKIYLMEKQCFSDPWSEKSLEAQLSGGNAIWFVYEENGVPAGYVLGTEVCGEAELYRIAVLSEYRRRGIGEKLMESFLGKCREMQVEKVFLEVRSLNVPAISLYEKYGFERISVRKGYYGDDDAVIFTKKL